MKMRFLFVTQRVYNFLGFLSSWQTFDNGVPRVELETSTSAELQQSCGAQRLQNISSRAGRS